MGKYIFIICSMMLVPDARQQYMQDFKAIAAKYVGVANISYTIQFKSFDTRGDKPDTILTGRYQIKGTKVYSKIGSAEMLANDKYVLRIDHQHKIAFINYASKSKGEDQPFAMIDSVIRKYKCTVNYTDMAGDIRKYKVDYGIGTVYGSSMTMEFNKSTHLISKMTMYPPADDDPYDQKPVKSKYQPFVDFVYSGYSFAEIPDATFEISKYVDISGKAVKPKGVFAKYQIINSLVYNQENR